MLVLTIPDREYFDEVDEVFVDLPGAVLRMEHSLVSISKWESFYEKPFLDSTDKTTEETLYYIQCMCLDEVDPSVFNNMTDVEIEAVNAYLEKKHTATWFNEKHIKGRPGGNQTINTSEVIYYYMVSLNIPFEAQYWNINRLITLIRVINIKNQPQKKMSKTEAMSRVKRLNAERKERYNTRG